MSSQFLHISHLHFSYPDSSDPVFTDLSLAFATGWTAVAGANGCGKSTLLKLIGNELMPAAGSIAPNIPALYCPQEAHQPPPGLEDFYADVYEGQSDAGRLFSSLGMDYDWPYRWDSLSFGERKRAQIGVALYAAPGVLLLDEPANHLDESGRTLLIQSLSRFRGIGLLVSHDRALMDELCPSTLLFDADPPRIYNCPWSTARAELDGENRRLRRVYEQEKKEERRLKQELQRRREENDRHQKDFSKRGLGKKDFDAKAAVDQARLSGRNAIGEGKIRHMDQRLKRHQNSIAPPPAVEKTGVKFSAQAFKSDSFFSLGPGSIPLGSDGRRLVFPELSMKAGEKIALSGENGSGKTSLLKHIVRSLPASVGEILYLPQELSENSIDALVREIHKLDNDRRGELLSHFSRLNGDPRSMLTIHRPSPGESRKLALARGLLDKTPMMILDEPGNHLDLPSITAIESAIAQYDGAVLVVSHDRRFRENLCNDEWRITRSDSGSSLAIFSAV